MKKRKVLLFGAGAVIPFGGPLTSELTDLIRNSASKFICCESDIKITEFLYQKLLESDSESNFETIISALEELIVHYSYSNSENKNPSFHKTLFKSKYEESILNFSIDGRVENHGFKLKIPKDEEYVFSTSAINNESPEQFYFMHLINVTLLSK